MLVVVLVVVKEYQKCTAAGRRVLDVIAFVFRARLAIFLLQKWNGKRKSAQTSSWLHASVMAVKEP